MYGLADDGVFHVQIVADRRDDDFAGVDADTDHDRHAMSGLNLV